MGAAGRDFHNFNMVLRDNPAYRVVAFTATQIPGISGRRYPAALAGAAYPEGIPILEDSRLEEICREQEVHEVMFAYSDVPHATVMHAASRALSQDADFVLLGPHRTMIQSARPVIAVSAVRTGCGKSQTARWLSKRLRDRSLRAAVIRHPMPYGDLARQAVQRFATREDLTLANCTIEEREEYEPHIAAGSVVFAGADYVRVLSEAEKESDIILWDGGNNDFPFIRPDLHIVLADALRPGQETTHHPGETVLRMADVLVIAKTDAAPAEDTERVAAALRAINPAAPIVRAASPVTLDDPDQVRGRRVLVVEDGPTITHGGMAYGAGTIAARTAGAAEILDPRACAVPEIASIYEQYPHIGAVLPALGYGQAQVEGLAQTIRASDADIVVAATPIDLGALIQVNKPVVRARYEFAETGEPSLAGLVDDYLARAGILGD